MAGLATAPAAAIAAAGLATAPAAAIAAAGLATAPAAAIAAAGLATAPAAAIAAAGLATAPAAAIAAAGLATAPAAAIAAAGLATAPAAAIAAGGPRKPTVSGDDDEDDPKYVSLRIPKSEYNKLKNLREKMGDKPDYSWVGSLALGAFVGLAAGLAFKHLASSDKNKDKDD